jgi:hypothetical protein
VTVGIDSHPLCYPNGIGLTHQASGSRFGKEDMHSRSLRFGQEFGDSVPDAPVKKGMHIFFTLRSVPSVASKRGCVGSDVPGHAPL